MIVNRGNNTKIQAMNDKIILNNGFK